MLIIRKSMCSGIERSIDLPITEEQMAAYAAGKLVQDTFPHLTAAQREFIITGITAEEWDEMFEDGEDEDDLASEDRC